MSSIDSPTLTPRSRSRRRLAAWLAFGVTGLAIGAVWATGFTSFTGTRGGAPVESPAMAKGAPTPDADSLNGKATKLNDLKVEWAGRWGSILADKVMVQVDLSAEDPAKEFNVALLLANTSDLTQWQTLQLKFEKATAVAAACASSDLATPTDPRVLNTDNQDAGVYWNGLAGGAVYCIGVKAADGDDETGTFLRAATDVAPLLYPRFITTVDRAL